MALRDVLVPQSGFTTPWVVPRAGSPAPSPLNNDLFGGITANCPMAPMPMMPLPPMMVSGDCRSQVYYWAQQAGVDPAKLYALALSESGCRQFDQAGRPLSGGGSAVGVMMVSPRWHPQFNAQSLMWDQNYNIMAGAMVFAECMRQSGGDLYSAIACYKGFKDISRSRAANEWAAYVGQLNRIGAA